MKNRIGVVILVLICLGLGIALISIKREAGRQKVNDTESIISLSNKVVDTVNKLEEQRNVATQFEQDLDKQKETFRKVVTELTNNYTMLSSNLVVSEQSLKESQDKVKQNESKIAELENQNQILDKKALDLSAAMTNLTTQITDTEKKLAASEGDKAFLEKELKRLMTEKAELERQFNDLTVLRAQVAKLKEELSIARRIEWIRQGLFASAEQKGAQKLMQGVAATQAKASPPKPKFDLNVEITSDGTVRVLPPATNSAALSNSPATK